MIDSHCHLNFEKLSSNLQNIINRCKENEVTKIISINTNPKEFKKHLDLIEEYNNVYIAYGIHPQEINIDSFFSFDDLRYHISNNKLIGLGETGLDFFHSIEFKKKQVEIFEAHIEASKLFDLPVNSTKRIIFHEITKSALQEALKYPKFIDLNIVQAQQTRQILDILVGFKFSPLLWKHISPAYKDGLSAGRCQTPALRLIYDNEIEINNNPGDKKFIISGFFTKNNVKFELNKKFDDEKIVMKFLNLSPSFQHTIQIEKTHITTTPPPIPFSTSLLQQKAHSYLNLSPKETMKLA